MNAVSGAQGEGGAGVARADVVLGDRDGTTCDSGFTAFVREHLANLGYDVKVNDPYKGVELVRAYSNPATRRMSLQLEVNKRLYMDQATRQKTAGFATLQKDLASLVDALLDYTASATRAA
jgi:N-formylglutamate amidohydrolase